MQYSVMSQGVIKFKQKDSVAFFSIIYFYLHSCMSPNWLIDLIHVSMKLSPGTTFGKWLVSRALQTL